MAEMSFDGLDDVEKMFEDIGRDIESADKQALKAGGEVIAKAQKDIVNRSGKDQHHIQDNITVSNVREDDEGSFVLVGPNKKVAWRANFLEYGTSKMPAYPFIENGADEAESDALSAMERVYLGVIKE